jgi:ABC-type phosphate transport system substrate-binding protein
MKNIIHIVVALAFLNISALARAEVAVVVNPSSGITSLTEDDVSRIFLGKSKSFPNGSAAVPINQDEGAPARDKFNEAICKKNSSQYKAYWSQLVFTGKGTPPKDAGNDAAVKALIAANPNMVGYVDASAVDASLKVVYKIP